MARIKDITYIDGSVLMQWLLQLFAGAKNPFKVIRFLNQSRIMILNKEYENGAIETAFLLMPPVNSSEIQKIIDLIVDGIKQGKSEQELQHIIKLFDANTENEQ